MSRWASADQDRTAHTVSMDHCHRRSGRPHIRRKMSTAPPKRSRPGMFCSALTVPCRCTHLEHSLRRRWTCVQNTDQPCSQCIRCLDRDPRRLCQSRSRHTQWLPRRCTFLLHKPHTGWQGRDQGLLSPDYTRYTSSALRQSTCHTSTLHMVWTAECRDRTFPSHILDSLLCLPPCMTQLGTEDSHGIHTLCCHRTHPR